MLDGSIRNTALAITYKDRLQAPPQELMKIIG
jgi:hypothetical protein